MSYNPNFYNIYRQNNFTFQNNIQLQHSYSLPPPPPPFMPDLFTKDLSDQEYIKKFENRIPKCDKVKLNAASISTLHEEILNLVTSYNNIQKQEKYLAKNIDILQEDEWRNAFKNVELNKGIITEILCKLSGSYLDISRKVLAKRSSKRLRLKRLRQERQQDKKEKIKELAETSRLIDENLQKIKDTIQKTKQEEEAKLNTDVVLRDVIRKKTEAKKSISKLEALVKLRRARSNTAKGRGEKVSDCDAIIFQGNVDKLKAMWTQRLALYEEEENELRNKLKQNANIIDSSNDSEKIVLENLRKWKDALFAGADPQVDFEGNVQRFIDIRAQWDRCLNENGSPLPIGWVLPNNQL